MLEQVGLLLEGGGMRGAYTSGVLDCFLDEKLYFEKDPEKLQALYQNGYDDAKNAIRRILTLCAVEEASLDTLTDQQLLSGLHREEPEGPGRAYC